MTVIVKHNKTNSITDWTQAQLNEQIALGNFPSGTTLANIVLPSDWNNDHTLTGLGTMAEQDATAVAITGGTINNTTIGATTATTGKFTSVTTPSVTATTNNLTLSAISTGKINLNTATANQVQITDSAVSAGQYTLLSRDNAVNEQRVSAAASSGGVNLGLSSALVGAVKFYTNGFAQQQLQVSHTASAVNYVQVTGAATGGLPIISAQGSDAAVALAIQSKGTSPIVLQNGSAQRQLRVDGTGAGTNYLNVASSATTQAPILSVAAASSDTNVSMAFQPKGTGAIDLAAGSSGVNISNGGTVTAITRTSSGGSYTSIPSVAITAPTTAGGVQATASAAMFIQTVSIVNGGTGYAVGNVLTVVGGTVITAATLTVSSVSAGVITGVTVTTGGTSYTVLPSNPVSVTGGAGSGATFNVTSWAVSATITITNAGSGYIEQPTITFSGGGGSGAAAYASVGSNPIVKSIFSTMSFSASAGEVLRLSDNGGTSANYLVALSGITGVQPQLRSTGEANTNLLLGSNGTGAIRFTTAGATATEQFRAAHTASAVNYVQVTGAATTAAPVISAQGSDTNIPLNYYTKGNQAFNFLTNGGSQRQFRITHTTSAVNFGYVTGGAAGTAVTFGVDALSSDTNIDLALTPKGTGLVRFGTYVAGALLATGYINIKAADGTTYKVLVST